VDSCQKLIWVDINGHPLVPLIQMVPYLGSFSTIFWVPNLRGHFEALNNILLVCKCLKCSRRYNLGHLECVLLIYTFLMGYRLPQMNIICKWYAPMKLTYQLTTWGPTNILAFHLQGLGFGRFRVFSLILLC
jgi:hypothetical protein